MSVKSTFDKKFVKKIAVLSKLKLVKGEEEYFSSQFNKTLSTISDLRQLNTGKVPEAYNITGLKNVFREDEIDNKRVLTQKEALSGAKQAQDGFFVVKGIVNEK